MSLFKFFSRHPAVAWTVGIMSAGIGGWLIHRQGWPGWLEAAADIVLVAILVSILIEPHARERRRRLAESNEESSADRRT